MALLEIRLTNVLSSIGGAGDIDWVWLHKIVAAHWDCFLQATVKVEYRKAKIYKMSILEPFLNKVTKLLRKSF